MILQKVVINCLIINMKHQDKEFVFADISAETTLDLYITRIKNYFDNIDVEKKNETKQKIDELNAILNTDLSDI